ncbi:MAG: secondary thiamine-phosphate synthase enzyme YjbQ [Alphaproteobacteria bacterium]|nr:secondary thiamine-phosphate synthase enzyme YjbQ [Alphaproteobacteria bacterium]MBU0794296.1 secondary thiamine-phosphate synthase enzyme YjbQ [Alphaproteobacteria bacterium]MBU0874897.1 secondary thiamine-phosphate synthase enzyme YjbQ [Alphaproteobacteria bacterium]MBU1769566.1 secondary thiamine-phosphate synthase enzyme YjbQ [Alphaproteobacteria bacterium]
MRQASTVLRIATPGQALVEITRDIARWVADQGMDEGLLTVFCRHTSASLTIQENAAPAVQRDLLDWLARMAPEDHRYAHDDEGPDDMPAHIRAMLTGVSLTVPLIGGRLALGTWQGIYLVEHRRAAHRRDVALHILGA